MIFWELFGIDNILILVFKIISNIIDNINDRSAKLNTSPVCVASLNEELKVHNWVDTLYRKHPMGKIKMSIYAENAFQNYVEEFLQKC